MDTFEFSSKTNPAPNAFERGEERGGGGAAYVTGVNAREQST